MLNISEHVSSTPNSEAVSSDAVSEDDSPPRAPPPFSDYAFIHVTSVALRQTSMSDLFIVLGFYDGTIRLYAPKMSMQETQVPVLHGGSGSVTSLALNICGQVLAVNTEHSKTAHLYHIEARGADGSGCREYVLHAQPFDQLTTGKWDATPEESEGHTRHIEGFCFSLRHEELLVTCAWDSTVRFWNLRSDRSAHVWRGCSMLNGLLAGTPSSCRSLERDNDQSGLKSVLCYTTLPHPNAIEAVCSERYCVQLSDGSIVIIAPCREEPIIKIHDPQLMDPCVLVSPDSLMGGPSYLMGGPDSLMGGPDSLTGFEKSRVSRLSMAQWNFLPRGLSWPDGVGKWACLAFDWTSGFLLLFKLEKTNGGPAPGGAGLSLVSEPPVLLLECEFLKNTFCAMAWSKGSESDCCTFTSVIDGSEQVTNSAGSQDHSAGNSAHIPVEARAKTYTTFEFLGILTAVSQDLKERTEVFRVLVRRRIRSDSDEVEVNLRLHTVTDHPNFWTPARVIGDRTMVRAAIPLQLSLPNTQMSLPSTQVSVTNTPLSLTNMPSPNFVWDSRLICDRHEKDGVDCPLNHFTHYNEAVTLCVFECGIALVSTSETAEAPLRAVIYSLPDIALVFALRIKRKNH